MFPKQNRIIAESKSKTSHGLAYPGFRYRIATTEGVLAVSAASADSAPLAAEACLKVRISGQAIRLKTPYAKSLEWNTTR